MKKTTSKASRAPATSSAIPAKPAAVPAPVSPAPKPIAVPAAAAPVPAPPPPAPKPPAQTVITATVDVGFGNTLTIRGEGAGLTWERGVPLSCATASVWSISLPATSGVVFKLLVNDRTWSSGENFSVAAGAKATVEPAF